MRVTTRLVGALCLALAVGLAGAQSTTTAVATFAGGCFWCMEPPFDDLPGVLATTSGYTGGHVKHPTYEQVSRENTGHFEAVQVTYDPSKVTYPELLAVFWRNIDPLDDSGQFCDRGDSYRTAIFYHGTEQQAQAEASAATIKEQLGADLATVLRPAGEFFPAEEYHQNYYQKNPLRYKFYRAACRRDARLKTLWGD